MPKLLPYMLIILILSYIAASSDQIQGFVSLDCGGKENFTDEIGLNWTSDSNIVQGETASIDSSIDQRKQYTTLRYFPADSSKYCYNIDVTARTRYLIRASFLYGNYDNNNVYPKFDIFFGASYWDTIVISDADTIESVELIFLASSPTISVCLSNATTGQPFISTLELRAFNASMYYTPYENQFYLSVSARINFGAENESVVRYPDDPFDRVWESDLVKRANYLVDVAAGTKRISTSQPIDIDRDEKPPMRVMQTAVVGLNKSLTYRMNLDGFPGFGWAVTYFAEIEDLGAIDSRKFRLIIPGLPDMSKAVVDIQENAHGKYRIYEPGYVNVSLPFVLSFGFVSTTDSSRGPLLNAMEISKYIPRIDGSPDGVVLSSIFSSYASARLELEGGDPCLPVPWSWVRCNSAKQPRVIKILLSKRNITGSVPTGLENLDNLVELWLDGNSLMGQIPDFTGCNKLEIIHIENNKLSGVVPSSLGKLPNLRELYLQDNLLTGKIPSSLVKKLMVLNYSGNVDLYESNTREKDLEIIIGSSVGAVILTGMILCYFIVFKKKEKQGDQEKFWESIPTPSVGQSMSESAFKHCFSFSEIEEATAKFGKKIGSGGFGVVYHGKLNDGREIAAKVLSGNSKQGKREFLNEVNLLSRIHHRNLVEFIGYCDENGSNMLVYEFMHNGTLKDHIYGQNRINWIKRLEIAEDAAKGIEYLHTGCIPAIIHRDLKTTNILLDKRMRAKVADFGLSKLAPEGATHVSSMVRGTVGYLDPEYYISQQLTEKSDVYSFGVILLELISGREAICNDCVNVDSRNIVQWAKTHVESGDIQGIIDPSLHGEYDIQSMWKIAEKALMCVQPHGHLRPPISEVAKDIHEAILIEKETMEARRNLGLSKTSIHSSVNLGSIDLCAPDDLLVLDDSFAHPSAR